ncbi:hypothetical protein [Spirochaeta isovalerica]|uniref:YD repeat-containing protein n=1 Tax=Spirochaeta isovalerica TaxID=150 RepID=A0A841R6B7_9SPIO|nr:hypothetical protein [Spirochaeta isovalerica]MBB6478931.1 hypothetical protein [Spirochaeta isovalerica]
MAMELEKLNDKTDWQKEPGWILQVSKDGPHHELVLYHNGSVDSRFERDFSSSGQLSYSSRSRDGLPVEETFYDTSGWMTKEFFYDDKGGILEEKNYEYSDDGKPVSVTISRTGQSGRTQVYSMRHDGSLRSVQTFEDQTVLNSSTVNSFDDTKFMDVQKEGNVKVVRYRNREGQLEKVVRFLGDKLILQENRTYSDTGILSEISIEDLSTGKKTFQVMNDSGLVSKEEKYLNDEFLERSVFFYDSGLLIRKDRRGSGVRETVIYKYEEDVLAEEEFFDRGILEYRKIYDLEDRRNFIQELYDRDELFMKVYYRKDVKTREEFISGGEVTRTREWGGS